MIVSRKNKPEQEPLAYSNTMAAIREPDKEGQHLPCRSGVDLCDPRDRGIALSRILLRIFFFSRQSIVTRN